MEQEHITTRMFKESEELLVFAIENNNNDYFQKAAEKFQELIDYYQRYIDSKPNDPKFDEFLRESGNEHVFTIARANLEHVTFEKEKALYQFYTNMFEYEKASDYFWSSQKHLDNAHQQLDKILHSDNVSKEMREFVEYDRRKWEFVKKQLKPHEYALVASKLSSSGKLLDALDNYRLAINEAEKLTKIVRDYLDVMEPLHIRFAESNLHLCRSNCAFTVADILFSKNKNNMSERVFLEFLEHLWEAYRCSLDAIRENPIGERFQHVAENQFDKIKTILKGHKDLWKPILIHFEDDKEFQKVMKNVDAVKFEKTKREITFKESKLVKIWSVGGLFILMFVIVIGCVTIVAKIIPAWLAIILLVMVEAIIIMIGAFTLRATGDLSEKAFSELITMAFKNQLIFLKKTKNKQNEETV